jgi:hypothetical protein
MSIFLFSLGAALVAMIIGSGLALTKLIETMWDLKDGPARG